MLGSGEAGIHREDVWSGPLGQAAGAPRSAAGFDVRALPLALCTNDDETWFHTD